MPSLLLAAGLEGIREGLDPSEPHTENMYEHSFADLEKMGINCLPRNLESAIESFATDPLSEKVMESLMYQIYIDFKTHIPNYFARSPNSGMWSRNLIHQFSNYNFAIDPTARPFFIIIWFVRSGADLRNPSASMISTIESANPVSSISHLPPSWGSI
jgi:Glutamine synthetase, catalytic domain